MPNCITPFVPTLIVVYVVPRKLKENPSGMLLQPPSSKVPDAWGTIAFPELTNTLGVVPVGTVLGAKVIDETAKAPEDNPLFTVSAVFGHCPSPPVTDMVAEGRG